MGNQFDALQAKINSLKEDADKFFNGNNKAAGTRLRVGLQEVKKLAQDLREEVSARKNA